MQRPMEVTFAKAVESGRSDKKMRTREEILVRLLRKRTYAEAAGMTGLEKILRDQIRWALPIRHD